MGKLATRSAARTVAVFGNAELETSFRHGQEDLANGRSRVFETADELIADLHDPHQVAPSDSAVVSESISIQRS